MILRPQQCFAQPRGRLRVIRSAAYAQPLPTGQRAPEKRVALQVSPWLLARRPSLRVSNSAPSLGHSQARAAKFPKPRRADHRQAARHNLDSFDLVVFVYFCSFLVCCLLPVVAQSLKPAKLVGRQDHSFETSQLQKPPVPAHEGTERRTNRHEGRPKHTERTERTKGFAFLMQLLNLETSSALQTNT